MGDYLIFIIPAIIAGSVIFLFVKIYELSTSSRETQEEINKRIGDYGESQVIAILGHTRIRKQIYVIHDLKFYSRTYDTHSRSYNSKTTQIDHVYINNKGIHVIETKNWGGRIYGRENNEQWTQVKDYGKEKNQYYNPIKQNEAHVKAVSSVLNMTIPILSYVVFTTISEVVIGETSIPVIYTSELASTISWQSSNYPALPKETLEKAYYKLVRANLNYSLHIKNKIEERLQRKRYKN